MKYLFVIAVGLMSFLLGLVAPLWVAIALPFINITEGELPKWAAWFRTPDNRLPGQLDIPEVSKVYRAYGWKACAWYWLGIRNRAHGFAYMWAKEVAGPWPPEPGKYVANLMEAPANIWWWRIPILGGRFQFKFGWRTYFVDAKWMAVPCMTVTKP